MREVQFTRSYDRLYQMLRNREIENSIEWLLKYGSDAVKYQTYKNILKDTTSLSSDLRSSIENSNLIKDIFSKQKPNGSWCSSGVWAAKATARKSGHTPVSPKYVTTAWILPILANNGYSISDKPIKKACDYMLSYQQPNGFMDEIKPEDLKAGHQSDKNEPCRFTISLNALGSVGAANDRRVKKAYELLLHWQREDGGWVSEHHASQKKWTRSCPYATYHAVLALYNSGVSTYETPIKRGLHFLLNHLSTKESSEIERFFYHGHSIIHELVMLTEFNIGVDSDTVQNLLKWLMTMYQPEGTHFVYTGKSIAKHTNKEDYMDSRVAKYRLFQLIEDDWLTYYATRIFQNIVHSEANFLRESTKRDMR